MALPSAWWSPVITPLDTNLEEAGVHGGCGADHMDVGGRCRANALEGGIGRGKKGEALRVSVLSAGAARGKAVKSLSNEWVNQSSTPSPFPIVNMCLSSHRENVHC